MRVALVITRGDEFGGAQLHTSYIADHLQDNGVYNDVITGSLGTFTDQLEDQGISLIHVPDLIRPIHPIRDILSVIRLVRLFRYNSYTLIAAHSSKAGLP